MPAFNPDPDPEAILHEEYHLINCIGIVVKPNKPEAIALALELIGWLGQRKIRVYLEASVASTINHPLSCSREEISQSVDLLIVLGGDGTLLSAVRYLQEENVPILGVNLGGLGFLTEITLEELYPVLERTLEGKVETEKRMKLSTTVIRQGRKEAHYTILNDVVISKSVLARIIHLRNSINGVYVTTYRGDGVIISTPTGSTAYSLAAGGPIVHPSMDSVLITPICPHTLTNRPLLVPDQATVEFTLETEESDVRLTLDGQVGCDLLPFDRVIITKAQSRVFFIKSPFKDYFQILRTKLKWGER
ncbi:MAG TPA: NAD(+)/NADH kinase [Thermodesulfobacteriota bacterium]|nr:NAD(+)/NADH kinase [Thermodesulfobacteriota bacterium]